nr:TonB-dependent receptor [Leptospiraceae bacterium]
PLKWLSITAGVRRDTYSDFGSTINPKTGLVITPFEKTKFGTLAFKVLYGSAFRAPTFQELYDKNQAYQVGGVFGNNTQRLQSIGTRDGGDSNPVMNPNMLEINNDGSVTVQETGIGGKLSDAEILYEYIQTFTTGPVFPKVSNRILMP